MSQTENNVFDGFPPEWQKEIAERIQKKKARLPSLGDKKTDVDLEFEGGITVPGWWSAQHTGPGLRFIAERGMVFRTRLAGPWATEETGVTTIVCIHPRDTGLQVLRNVQARVRQDMASYTFVFDIEPWSVRLNALSH